MPSVARRRAAAPAAPCAAVGATDSSTSERAEAIRRALADAWGQMGAAWGVAPAIARVHGYLLSHQAPLTEREVREALGLSHRAASLALAESEVWGLVERVPEPRRVGRRGPPGVAFRAVGDHWHWFIRIVDQRKLREGDPVLVVIADAAEEARRAAAEHPADAELVALRDWLTSFHDFVRLFDRSIGIVPQLDPRELERALRLIGRVPDETALRLVRLLVEIPGRRRPPAARGDVAPLAGGRAPGDEAHRRRGPDGRPLGSAPRRAPCSSASRSQAPVGGRYHARAGAYAHGRRWRSRAIPCVDVTTGCGIRRRNVPDDVLRTAGSWYPVRQPRVAGPESGHIDARAIIGTRAATRPTRTGEDPGASTAGSERAGDQRFTSA